MKILILSDSEIQSINQWISKMNQYKDIDQKKKVKNAKSHLQLKYEIIGKGQHRIVYDLQNGYVLKVAISEHGVTSNENENKIYLNCPPYLRKYLCPVIEFGQGWIIMEKMVSKITKDEEYYENLSKLKNKFLMYEIDPKDMNSNNMALSKTGEIMIIDYGNFILKQGKSNLDN
ncbi:hypothetical protein ACSU6B_24480 [Neobacillus sp. C211]|uniref:hypothetical protein n=1 Tax=unclassified Neobacillus TaxID=2675272 RepID=UPI00397A173F